MEPIKMQVTCESIQQNQQQYVARFVVFIPNAAKVENKIPVKSAVTIQLAGLEEPGYKIGQEYELNISPVQKPFKKEK